MQPGMEKIYFYLEEEIMKPRYEIHAYDVDLIAMPRPMMEKEHPELVDAGRREMAGKVLLAAAEGIGDSGFTVNTYNAYGKAEEYQKYVANRLGERYQKIRKALGSFQKRARENKNNYLGKLDWNPKDPLPMSILVDERLLSKKDLLDPWGNEFKFEGQWCQSCMTYHYFILTSAGPDGKVSTADDIALPAMHGGRAELERMQLRGGEKFAAMDAADGELDDGAAFAKEVMPMGAMLNAKGKGGHGDMKRDGGSGGAEEAPRIRKFFPETLYFNPLVITDEKGEASIDIKLADSITTWRLTTMASSLKGELGSTTSGIRVFQDFFIDIDFPVSLYQNDEVSVPVAVYNYLETEQDIRLKAEEGDWFKLLGPAEKTVTLGPGKVGVEYFTVKVDKIGNHRFTVYGYGSKKNDAVSREIEVMPDGKEFIVNETGRLDGKVAKTIDIPADAIDDASKIFVKIYPGVFSQAIEGMDKILRMPNGCFEQTSSATYPNILVLDYMKTTGKVTPEIQMKAESFINTGYQRLLSFEVPGGGFEWFGKAPAHNILTAYGLMEFYDMSKVHDVDPNIINRTQNWLVGQQQDDGSWKPTEGGIAEGAINKYRNDVLRSTAYITWALVSTGYQGPALNKAFKYIDAHLDEADDTYTYAVLLNAYVTYDPQSETAGKIITSVMEKRIEDDETIHWQMDDQTPTHGSGEVANIEVTALMCQALVKEGRHNPVVSKVNNYLIKMKDSYGTWQSTQATIQALRAMLMSNKEGTQKVEGTITLDINGKKSFDLKIDATNNEILQIIDLKDWTVEGSNSVSLNIEGEGSMFYQIVGRYYEPYEFGDHGKEPMTIDVEFDKTTLASNDVVHVDVSVTNNRPATAKMIIVDLGTPPGFDVVTPDLEALVEKGTIEKFSMTGRQIIIYLREVGGNGTLKFGYNIVAKYPIKAKTTASKVYEYYNPDIQAVSEPQEIVVTKE